MKIEDLYNIGTYVAVTPTATTQKKLEEWAHDNDIELQDNLHVTILYSTVPILPQARPSPEKHIAKFLAWDVFGHREKDEYLVARLIAPSIDMRHLYYKDHGGTHDYPTFNAHMTICKYSEPRKFFTPFNFDLVFENEYMEPLSLP